MKVWNVYSKKALGCDLSGSRKSTHLPNRRLIVLISNKYVDDFVGELTLSDHSINTLIEIRFGASRLGQDASLLQIVLATSGPKSQNPCTITFVEKVASLGWPETPVIL